MAYSADNQQEHQLNLINATAAPPPTPVAQPNSHLVSSAAAADVLSSLLRRLPPTLSLPTRRSCNTTTTTTSAPVTSLSDPDRYDLLLSASSELGFFQLTDHNIPSQLANSAELEALSLFDLTRDKKEAYFPKNWPLGFEDDEYGTGESFWFDPTCSSESSELGLDSLRELSQALEKVALEIVEMLSSASRFESPGKVDPTRVCSLMLVHQSSHGDNPATSGGSYPYVVGLQYQIRSQKFSILADSGWTTVSPQVNSVMVTIGDVAQVWSNGAMKKVRGRPVACLGNGGQKSHRISMTLLLTLPLGSTVSPLLPKLEINSYANEKPIEEDDEQNGSVIVEKEKKSFSSFSFEDYAWRVYHDPPLSGDPLDVYRI
uniref:Gibberellin 2-beta-dioxygenase 2 n=1 Tax=Rhizophora mucronata TaxID=61149 RepID=A0A2P2JCS8_RHIMU